MNEKRKNPRPKSISVSQIRDNKDGSFRRLDVDVYESGHIYGDLSTIDKLGVIRTREIDGSILSWHDAMVELKMLRLANRFPSTVDKPVEEEGRRERKGVLRHERKASKKTS